MKLFNILLIALVASFAKASGSNLRTDRKLQASEDRELTTGMHVTEVTIDREVDGEGQVPQGRAVSYDSDHELMVPPEIGTLAGPGDGHGRDLGSGAACYSCWWDSYYGYITYCCAYTSNYYSCGYYYC